MKKFYKIVTVSSLVLLMAACSNEEPESIDEQEKTEEVSEKSNEVEPTEEVETETEEEETETRAEESATTEISTETSEESNDALAAYSTEEIEYARVWLQFGPNPDIEEIYVEKIFEGIPINTLDEGSLTYPEDVIQLAGGRLVDGVVTYSSNGDGTINLYNVPARWENPNTYDNDSSVMEEETRKIIENTQTEYVEPGDDQEVAEMAERIQQ